jgi:hypothetical protein
VLAQERIDEIRAELLAQGYYLKCRPNVYAAAMRDVSLEFPPKPLAAAVRCALIGRLPDGSPPQLSASGATDREAAEKAFDEWQRQADDARPPDEARPGAAPPVGG